MLTALLQRDQISKLGDASMRKSIVMLCCLIGNDRRLQQLPDYFSYSKLMASEDVLPTSPLMPETPLRNARSCKGSCGISSVEGTLDAGEVASPFPAYRGDLCPSVRTCLWRKADVLQ